MAKRISITVTLNGGPVNIWNDYNLRCNPFPQLACYEDRHANRLLQALDSDPLTSTDQIRHILAGCDQAFIDLCVRLFKPGERVQFKVWWPDA